MVIFTSLKTILNGVIGCGVATAVVYKLNVIKKDAENSWTTNYEPSVKWDFNWDRRDPGSSVKPPRRKGSVDDENRYNSEIENAKSKATRHLILVRHGQYNMTADSQALRTLTALGREQADFTGRRLKELKIPFNRMVRSTMTRAQETAEIIYGHLADIPVENCELLREGAPIPPEPPVGHWKPEAMQFFVDGARIEAAFRKYFFRAPPSQTEDSYDLLVCHGNVIRYCLCRVLQFPPEAWLRFNLYNCSMSWVCIKPDGRVVVYSIGDVGHLPPDKLTTS